MLARPFQRHELSFDTALAETRGDDHAVEAGKQLAYILFGDFFGMDIADFNLAVVISSGLEQRLVDRLVGILDRKSVV